MANARANTGDRVLEVAPTQLNPTDATLWDIERNPELRTTIVAAMLLDRPVKRKRLLNVLEAASRRIPRLRQRVVGGPAGIGAPHWEIDRLFNLDDHVSFIEASEGVDRTVIAAAAAPMASSPLNRERPLWECTYLGGATGPAALILKVHHSLTDGVGGMGLLDVMLDRTRDAKKRDLSSIPVPVQGQRAAGPDGETDVALRRAVGLSFDIASKATTTAFHPVKSWTGALEGARSAARLLAPSSDPLSPLMTGRSVDRHAGTCELELERMHDAAAKHGCTINQAYFAGVIGGLAAYHRELDMPTDRLRASMPVSTRRPGHAKAGNQWAPVRFVVPTDVDDPVERMLAMRALVESSRREKALGFSQSLAGAIQILPSALSSGLVGQMMHGVDANLTNVPGLAEPHFLAGALVERVYAFAPTAGAALSVGLVSHLGIACIGTISDAAAVTDPDLLNELIAAGLHDVIHTAEKTPRSEQPAPEAEPAEAESAAPAPEHPAAERLSAVDTSFLRLETPDAPLHIGGVFVLEGEHLRDDEGKIRLDDARKRIESRLRHIPRFRRRLSEVPFGLGRPLWVDDDSFDIERHVQLTSVASPGEHQDLLDICAELYTEQLDRSVPLWELWLIDGLADGRVGIVEKIHHALIDGISGVELAAAIFDGQADPPEELPADESADGAQYVPDPPAAQRAADALREQVVDPVQTAGRVGSTVLTSPGQVVEQINSIVASIRDIARIGAKAPETSFNHQVGKRRALRVVPLDLDVVHSARAPHHATVNDLVLTTIAGALRHWMIDSGDPLVDVHVFAPMSTRHDPMGAEPGNRVGGMLVELPVGEADPIWRLELVKSRMARLKQQHEGESVAAVFDALDHLPAIGYAAVLRLLSGQPLVNVVVTNLPGPRDPLFFLGDRIEQMIPVVPLGMDMGLGIAVLSYLDRLTVSLFADPDACHDLDLLADCVASEFDVLVAALEADATS